MAYAPKVYDFAVTKVEDKLVAFLKKKGGESTVADMIAGTALPKYQVEQTAKMVLDEYAGRLKVTESGELLYYFPSGMRNTVRGFWPSLRRFWKTFAKKAITVLSLLFKVWIVAMLVGYFVAFLALAVLAILASFAASAAGRGERGGRSRGSGFGGMYLVMRLLDLILRMWIWSNLLNDPRRKKAGRPFYKSVFSFVFGEEDPNKGWDDEERKYVIAYIRSKKGVITLEELMALAGKESEEANKVMNRFLIEFEGEPSVTDNGTVVYLFPALLRTSEAEQRAAGRVSLVNPVSKKLILFSANPRKTNGWISFFNAFNLAFGVYFLSISLTQGAAALTTKGGPVLYAIAGSLFHSAGMSVGGAVALITGVLGIVPLAFSALFFLVPLFRKMLLEKRNAGIKEEALRRRIFGHVLSSPLRVDPRDIAQAGTDTDPKSFPAVRKRILERFAALKQAEPIAQGKDAFTYRFAELEREIADVEEYRKKVDLKRYEVGKTVFDSGQ